LRRQLCPQPLQLGLEASDLEFGPVGALYGRTPMPFSLIGSLLGLLRPLSGCMRFL